jgi:hypothetical protein
MRSQKFDQNSAQVERYFGLFCASCLFSTTLTCRMLNSTKILANGAAARIN